VKATGVDATQSSFGPREASTWLMDFTFWVRPAIALIIMDS
jgi:hypothetical protein